MEAALPARKASDEVPLPLECWCLHGAVGAASDWRTFAKIVAKVGISTRAVDLWRFLECESVSMSDFGKRLNAQAEGEVSRGRRGLLVGYSMGGRLALHGLLEGGPWCGAVIISANPGISEPDHAAHRRADDAVWASKALTMPWADFLSEWNAQSILGGAIRDSREDSKLIQRRREIARSFIDWSLGAQQSLWERLAEISIPVLWIAGEHDGKFSLIATQAAALSDHFQLAIAPNSGHRVPWDAEAWLVGRVREFCSALS
jgi:2-succinyl-6-hydroxy-2,4-cyclohexadiene-1-carboxylate synthase